jgi:hypothetical protein
MSKLRNTILALLAGFTASAACSHKNDTRENAENAAQAVRDKTTDLQDEAKDLNDTAKDKSNDLADKSKDTVDDLKDDTKDVTKTAVATRDAVKEFEYQRMVRVQTLRAVHGIVASQPLLINAIAQSTPFVDADRAKIVEKVQLVQMRLDEAANLIQSLEGVDADHWEGRERETANAMNRLEDARDDAWDALENAKRIDRTSMR